MSKNARRRVATIFALAVAGATLPMVPMTGVASAATGSAPQAEKQVYIVQTTGTSRAQAVADPGKRANAVRSAYGVAPRKTFRAVLSGFSASMTPQQAAALAKRADVVQVVPNRTFDNLLDATETGKKKPRAADPTWGLDRIDQRQLPLDGTYAPVHDGTGVSAYIIDSGVNPDHPDFGGRATQAVNLTTDGQNTDCNGHGTHVAGTVGSTTYGVAKSTSVVGVKALDCGGGSSEEILLASLEWVTENAAKPAVVNTSWRWPSGGTLLKPAVEAMVQSGVFHATSAGNTYGDSCDVPPRNSELPLVVANSTITDARAASSSTGACVDVYAPGTNIVSLDNDGSGTVTLSGTSMATPHAAGVGALYLQQNPGATPAEVKAWIEDSATPDIVSGGSTGGTVNRLLYTNGL